MMANYYFPSIYVVAGSVLSLLAVRRVPLWWSTLQPCVDFGGLVCGSTGIPERWCTPALQRAILLPLVALFQWFCLVAPSLAGLDRIFLEIRLPPREQRAQKSRMVCAIVLVIMPINFLCLTTTDLRHTDGPPPPEVLPAHVSSSGKNYTYSELDELSVAYRTATGVAVMGFIYLLGPAFPQGSTSSFNLLRSTLSVFPALMNFGRVAMALSSGGDSLLWQRAVIRTRGPLAFSEYVKGAEEGVRHGTQRRR
jgi:hypothetical protein